MARATVQQFLAGEDRAVDEVRRWAGAVVRFARWRFADPESIVQDVLLKLVEIGRAEGLHDGERFRRLVHAVARNTCIDQYRRERLRSRPGTFDPPREFADDDPEADQVARDRVRLFAGIFRSLSQDCRRLLRWIYGEGLSAAEAGVRLGLTANNIRVRAHRCTERARALARAAQAGGAGGPA